MPAILSTPRRGLLHRGYSNIRTLEALIRQERDIARIRRLNAVALLLKRRIPRREIHARTGFPPSTVYGDLHRLRERGPHALCNLNRPGRPNLIPNVVRERFAYLCRPDPDTGRSEVLYVIERERLVFKVLGHRFTTRQVSKWFGRLVKDNDFVGRFRKFRLMRPAYKFLRGPEIERIYFLRQRTPADFKRMMRVDVLSYASYLNPKDRELFRRLISATHKIPLKKIAFGGEPGLDSADFAWDEAPEDRQPVDIFAANNPYRPQTA